MATKKAPRNPRRSAAELKGGQSRTSVSVGPRPQVPEETADRVALRRVLASKVWVVDDLDAYAAELEADFELTHS